MRCAAKSKRSGERCKRHASAGRTVCRMHGGRSLQGVQHPNWQGKGYSKDLPTQLRDRFMASVDDPHLSSCRNELALIDARMGELFESGVSSPRQWARVIELVDLRRKVANTESRRESLLMTHLTSAQARALIGCIVEALMMESDEVRVRVLAKIRLLMAKGGLAVEPERPGLPQVATIDP